jgi:hypothetical protein
VGGLLLLLKLTGVENAAGATDTFQNSEPAGERK